MRPIALALVFAIVLAGCATARSQASNSAAPQSSAALSPGASQLAGTQWRFVALHGDPLPPGVVATLHLDKQNRASGRAGCNSYGASYLAGGDGALHFGQMLSTKMACLQPAGAMDTERGVMDALSHTARARIDDGEMILLDVTGKALATLQPQAQ